MKLLGAGLCAFSRDSNFVLPAFKQRLPWIGADLQTVRNSFTSSGDGLAVDERLSVPIGGGGALSIAVTQPSAPRVNTGKPLRALVLVHGLGGSEDSSYMKNTARYFAARGWAVYRMNYRGVGPSKATSTAPYSAGLTGDMRAVLKEVATQPQIEDVYAMGFSLGGQLLMRTLGEGDVDANLRAVVTVSAPLDLATSQQRLERRRNAFYVRYLVDNMKRDMEGISHASITADLEKIQTVLDFDEHIIAPYFGFNSAQDYYRCVSCLPLIEKIGVPLLAIHSADDPWIPAQDYLNARWPAHVPAGAVLLKRGGHVGFHGTRQRRAWFKPAAEKFFQQFT